MFKNSNSAIAMLVLLQLRISMCSPRRASETNARYISTNNIKESAGRPMYRKISRKMADCDSIVDSPVHCPYIDGYSTHPHEENHEISVSPWITKLDIDPTRLPETFPVVCCTCRYCVDLSTGIPKPMLDHYSEAVYVKHEVRRMEDGFRLRYVKLAVGCTCVYRPIFP
uniref:uncharacterized protein LOC120328775 n=1 Tax=Styela clava TaxID=7725 RepID=UPI00193972EF|nr:uncharacterized protein LOC120328775 [Styela clava]